MFPYVLILHPPCLSDLVEFCPLTQLCPTRNVDPLPGYGSQNQVQPSGHQTYCHLLKALILFSNVNLALNSDFQVLPLPHVISFAGPAMPPDPMHRQVVCDAESLPWAGFPLLAQSTFMWTASLIIYLPPPNHLMSYHQDIFICRVFIYSLIE